MESNVIELKAEERLPWHKPEMARLIVSMDTAFAPGSGVDLEHGSREG